MCLQPGGGGGGGAAACVPEAHVVMQITVDDFITLVHGYVQVGAGGWTAVMIKSLYGPYR